LYLLQRYPKYGVQEIERHATSLALVEGSARHEAAQLVKNTFGQLSLPTQENILLQMDAGPDEEEVRKWFAFIGKEATPESLAQFGTVWRAQRFALVADQVPAAWTERVNEIIKSAGTVRQLEATDDKAQPRGRRARQKVWGVRWKRSLSITRNPTRKERKHLIFPIRPMFVSFLADWKPH
jgi:hypothetical protein